MVRDAKWGQEIISIPAPHMFCPNYRRYRGKSENPFPLPRFYRDNPAVTAVGNTVQVSRDDYKFGPKSSCMSTGDWYKFGYGLSKKIKISVHIFKLLFFHMYSFTHKSYEGWTNQ